jgi:hypothetical protein
MGGEARRSVLFALPLIAIRGKSVVLMMGYLRFELPFFVHLRKKSRQKSVKANEFFYHLAIMYGQPLPSLISYY